MSQIEALHREAMENVDLALIARSQGNESAAVRHFSKAFELESNAVELAICERVGEPTTSVLIRSAATLALDSENVAAADQMLGRAFQRKIAEEIKSELLELRVRVDLRKKQEYERAAEAAASASATQLTTEERRAGLAAIAFEAVDGFLQASELPFLPKLTLEKLLVLLTRVGSAHGFFDPFLTNHGAQSKMLRIAYYMHGAISVLASESEKHYPSESWFSQFLVKGGVLRVGRKSGYMLGENIARPKIVSPPLEKGRELGVVFGLLSKEVSRGAPLDSRSITVLATCGTALDTLGALQAELRIFRDWFERNGNPIHSQIQWSNRTSVSSILKSLLASKGHTAVHSARLKYCAFKAKEAQETIRRCHQYLVEKDLDSLAHTWNQYWEVINLRYENESSIEIALDSTALICWELGVWLAAAEIALEQAIDGDASYIRNSGRRSRAADKYARYAEAMRITGLTAPEADRDLQAIVGSASPIDVYRQAVRELRTLSANVSLRIDLNELTSHSATALMN